MTFFKSVCIAVLCVLCVDGLTNSPATLGDLVRQLLNEDVMKTELRGIEPAVWVNKRNNGFLRTYRGNLDGEGIFNSPLVSRSSPVKRAYGNLPAFSKRYHESVQRQAFDRQRPKFFVNQK